MISLSKCMFTSFSSGVFGPITCVEPYHVWPAAAYYFGFTAVVSICLTPVAI
jgi:hypothetical protein